MGGGCFFSFWLMQTLFAVAATAHCVRAKWWAGAASALVLAAAPPLGLWTMLGSWWFVTHAVSGAIAFAGTWGAFRWADRPANRGRPRTIPRLFLAVLVIQLLVFILVGGAHLSVWHSRM